MEKEDTTKFREELLEDCPDCGGFLVGEICHECKVRWKFSDIIKDALLGDKE